ncbi:hypothetical protein ILUMI_13504 [Ignelater luminosus]|uniref:Uncharacterized protein n=1 Tax=Ignelater luminosus TaxID=2038154 RepID=A0A8K0CXP2_IGNLU|nr:hypothetical protein ILUMI_13504 [Ignelater luminosus]
MFEEIATRLPEMNKKLENNANEMKKLTAAYNTEESEEQRNKEERVKLTQIVSNRSPKADKLTDRSRKNQIELAMKEMEIPAKVRRLIAMTMRESKTSVIASNGKTGIYSTERSKARTEWENMKKSVTQTAEEMLGPGLTKKNNKWFDEDGQKTMKEKMKPDRNGFGRAENKN